MTSEAYPFRCAIGAPTDLKYFLVLRKNLLPHIIFPTYQSLTFEDIYHD